MSYLGKGAMAQRRRPLFPLKPVRQTKINVTIDRRPTQDIARPLTNKRPRIRFRPVQLPVFPLCIDRL